jgi:hypothetical protein
MRGAAVLAIPAVALALLSWFGVSMSGQAETACAAWADQYRVVRDDLSILTQLWQAAGSRGHHPPDWADLQTRVKELVAARPARCDNNGRQTS